MQGLHLLQDTLCGRGGRGSGWLCLLIFLGLRLQPFPLFFLLLLADGPGIGWYIPDRTCMDLVCWIIFWVELLLSCLNSVSVRPVSNCSMFISLYHVKSSFPYGRLTSSVLYVPGTKNDWVYRNFDLEKTPFSLNDVHVHSQPRHQ